MTPRLAETDSELRDFVESVALPILWFARDGTIVWANAAELNLLGYTAEEYIGHNIRDFHVDPHSAQDLLTRLTTNQDGQEYEARLRRRDGSVIDVAVTSRVYRRNGEFVHVQCVTREIGPGHAELQTRLAAIVDSSDDAIVSKDLNGVIRTWNRGAEKMFGYRADEVVGQHISLLAPPDRLGDIQLILERIAKGEQVDHFETKRRTKDGRILTVSLSVSPVRDHWGRIVGASKIARDITEQNRLGEAQARLAAIVDSADDAIISKDLNGLVQSWNRAAEALFGYSADEMIGRHISVLAPPERVDEIPRILERIARGERVHHHETQRRTKDGRTLTVALTVSPIRDRFGVVVGASKIARDITEQKRLRELQVRMAAIVESSDDAILSKDVDGYIQSWNRGAERIFGYTADEIIGKHISVLAAPDCIDEIPVMLARLRRGERIDHYQTKRRTKDGRILVVSLTISPILDASGNVVGISKIARDVTEQVRSQDALRVANEALARSNADLEQFAYSASHDLQEPLRTIGAYTGMLKRKFSGQLGPEGDQYIQFTTNGVKRMHQLLNDLLDYTRASTTAPSTEEETDASEVLTEVLDHLKAAIGESGASVTSGDLPKVRMRHAHLHQILQNLIVNSIRYRGANPPSIHVSACRQGEDWLISVQDNGIGIDPQYKELIFGIFKRLHTAAEYPGSGMGLAICQRLVQRAGGRIWVESELGQGSAFRFTVPLGPGA
jgi:PAS domain S-box-containing protein